MPWNREVVAMRLAIARPAGSVQNAIEKGETNGFWRKGRDGIVLAFGCNLSAIMWPGNTRFPTRGGFASSTVRRMQHAPHHAAIFGRCRQAVLHLRWYGLLLGGGGESRPLGRRGGHAARPGGGCFRAGVQSPVR